MDARGDESSYVQWRCMLIDVGQDILPSSFLAGRSKNEFTFCTVIGFQIFSCFTWYTPSRLFAGIELAQILERGGGYAGSPSLRTGACAVLCFPGLTESGEHYFLRGCSNKKDKNAGESLNKHSSFPNRIVPRLLTSFNPNPTLTVIRLWVRQPDQGEGSHPMSSVWIPHHVQEAHEAMWVIAHVFGLFRVTGLRCANTIWFLFHFYPFKFDNWNVYFFRFAYSECTGLRMVYLGEIRI